MVSIGLLSDTHGYWDERYLKHFAGCDEIWHAGDIGSQEIVDRLSTAKMLRAVHGNIDGYDIRRQCSTHLRFKVESVDVWLTHIGGYPGKYVPEVCPEIFIHPPRLFVCGHSHILKVKYDRTLQLLHINPGAAGKQGMHAKRTLVRFVIDGETIRDLEVIELSETTPPAINQ
jgi:putative phosphoesterase